MQTEHRPSIASPTAAALPAGPCAGLFGELPPRSPLRAAVTAATRPAEPACVAALLDAARLPPADAAAAHALALRLARGLRTRKTGSGRDGLVQGLIQEFSLSSQEGVALMCLAEALLRIPDRATRDALIRDKIGGADWQAHLGRSPSLFVNAATWGLLVTGRLVATHTEQGLASALARVVAKSGEPVVRKGVDMAMRLMGEQFVTGETIEAALANARAREREGFRYSYDMLGEAALTAADAERYCAAYRQAIGRIGAAAAGRGVFAGPGISIKLSALHPRYARAQRGRVLAELYPTLLDLATQACRCAIGLNIDAEEADRLELSLDLLEQLAFEPALAGWDGLGFVVQAYQKRCGPVLDVLVDLARRSRRRLMVRLVKGAYWDSEIKRAQVDGLVDYPVYTRKVHTDLSYLAAARRLLDAPAEIYPQFATHNAHTLAAIWRMAGPDIEASRYEFQCLHGMGEPLYAEVVAPRAAGGLGRPCRIYAPVGTHETLLAYLVRRLLENGANTSFVNRIADERIALEELVADPVETVERSAAATGVLGAPHPAIPLPAALYGDERRNSAGIDIADESSLAVLAAACVASAERAWRAVPLVDGEWRPGASGEGLASEGMSGAGSSAEGASAEGALAEGASAEGASAEGASAEGASGARRDAGSPGPVVDPSDRRSVVGTVIEASSADIADALAAAERAAPAWSATPAVERAAVLDRAADVLQARMPVLMALIVREAGKTQANALGEVREAIDFLRYYAAQARRELSSGPRGLGVVVCISPWNFPLAIFTGQVAAALAAGNAVLAKPAEQTPLIAAEMVRLLVDAGIPAGALQLLPGRGESVGAALVADPRVRGVLFTGSNAVAQSLQRALAGRVDAHGRPATLIAETGGQNAMIVDSSALLEQVVADVVASAFDSAGQRCSALRVLCLQEDIAERALAMLLGALRELAAGAPGRLATDIGPVIDAEARDAIEAHIAAMQAAGRIVHRPLPIDAGSIADGTFVAPAVIELKAIGELRREVFGPVLHVVRFRRDELAAVVDAIDATGYGLTLGIHTRIDETIEAIVGRIHAGNVYVNRNMVGAVVGVQPFGGEGLSGTGPKAGGPLYLRRLVVDAAITPDILGVADASDLPVVAVARGVPVAPDGAHADAHSALRLLRDWLVERADAAGLVAACDRLAARAPTPTPRLLPGPTGERNTHALVPRTTVLCIAETPSELLLQLAVVLAAGSRAGWLAGAVADRLRAALPPALQGRVVRIDDPLRDCIDAALVRAERETVRAWSRRLAARQGPIVALHPLPSDPAAAAASFAIERLMVERTLSVNTAAAGGNASLMTIG